MAQVAGPIVPVTREVAPGVRLHLLSTDRFTTALCRVVLHRDLGAEATATSLLALVLQSATGRHPTRRALAHALADLYGASLQVTVSKAGARQLLISTLEWPTLGVPDGRRRGGGRLARGLALLGEVLARPKRQAGRGSGPLDADLVRTEQVNLLRMLCSLADDKPRRAWVRCVEEACRGEPFALEALGRAEAVGAATPAVLAELHARLLATAPVDVFLVADVGIREAVAVVRKHLLWPGRAQLSVRPPVASAARPARARPRRVVEEDDVQQGQLVFAWRSPVRADAALLPAAAVLAGVFGGGTYSRLFQVVREKHALCYHADAQWIAAQGLLLAQVGVEPADEPRTRRLVQGLAREVASGRLDPVALDAYRAGVRAQVATLGDDRAAWLAWLQGRTTLGLDPDPVRWADAVDRVTPARVRRVGRNLRLEVSYALLPRGSVRRGP